MKDTKRKRDDDDDDDADPKNTKPKSSVIPQQDDHKSWLLCRMIPNDLCSNAIVDPFLNRYEKNELLQTVVEFQGYVGSHFCPEHATLLPL